MLRLAIAAVLATAVMIGGAAPSTAQSGCAAPEQFCAGLLPAECVRTLDDDGAPRAGNCGIAPSVYQTCLGEVAAVCSGGGPSTVVVESDDAAIYIDSCARNANKVDCVFRFENKSEGSMSISVYTVNRGSGGPYYIRGFDQNGDEYRVEAFSIGARQSRADNNAQEIENLAMPPFVAVRGGITFAGVKPGVSVFQLVEFSYYVRGPRQWRTARFRNVPIE